MKQIKPGMLFEYSYMSGKKEILLFLRTENGNFNELTEYRHVFLTSNSKIIVLPSIARDFKKFWPVKRIIP